MQIEVYKGDITKIEVDVIVNAARSSLMGGGGVDGAIHRAGGPEILKQCAVIRQKRGGCLTGEAVITTGGRLPSKHVIHTVGPVWKGGNHAEPDLLNNCYRNSLILADEHQLSSVAFPNISTGVFGYPKELAAKVALAAVRKVTPALEHVKAIHFVCFDQENYDLYQQALAE